jgi:hypothetical protein
LSSANKSDRLNALKVPEDNADKMKITMVKTTAGK